MNRYNPVNVCDSMCLRTPLFGNTISIEYPERVMHTENLITYKSLVVAVSHNTIIQDTSTSTKFEFVFFS